MLKLLNILAFLCATAILAEESHWYPTNHTEIEAHCRQQFPTIGGLIVEDNGNLRIKDSQALRSFFICCGTHKNIFKPELGFNAERIVYDIKQTYKFNCNVNLVEDCIENNKQESQTEEVWYFNVMKCVLESASGECDRVIA